MAIGNWAWLGVVLQYSRLYCKCVWWLEDYIAVEKLYCREGGLRAVYVAIHLLYCDWGVGLTGIVLQYNILYCDGRGSRLLDCVATQGRDTAQGRAGR